MKTLYRFVLGLCVLPFFAAVPAEGGATAAPVTLNIAAQPLDQALNEFARQSGLQVIFRADQVTAALTSRPLAGKFDAEEALKLLLADSGLGYRYLNARTIAVRPREEGRKRAETTVRNSPDAGAAMAWRVAQGATAASVTQSPQENSSAVDSRQNSRNDKVEEIVVTAQKRVERLQDVPVPVSVVNAEALVNSNQLRLQDYYTKIPGLNLTMLGDVGQPVISIRGITTGGYINPTVGIVVDDVPFGGSSAVASAAFTLSPDFDPSELSRVEVLRGPQGTLYGASSLGGLLKYVTVDPSTERMSSRFQIGTSSVRQSDDLGYSVHGSVNVPLSDTFAVRASGSTRADPGYVDNVQTGQDDINRTDSDSGRLAALWKPSDIFSLKLSALYQHSKRDGASDTHLPPPVGRVAGLRDLQQSALINSGTYNLEFQAYSATMTAKIGRSELVSLSGYSVGRLASSLDASPALGTSSVQSPISRVKKFSQELRLSSPLGERVDWLLGAFYTHESYPTNNDILAINPTTGAVTGTLLHTDSRGSYAEYAAFTDLTFQLSERFDIQVGARGSSNKITYSSVGTGPFSGAPTPRSESNDDSFTYLLTPRFKVSPDLMVYARLASGYRPGGPNSFVQGTIVGVPTEFGHDTTETYEIGVKGDIFARALSFDASLYYIDWKDVQLQLRDQLTSGLFQTYTLNAGGAKSEGVEFSLESRPLEGLTVSLWASYNNAKLTEVPANGTLAGFKDAKLPYSAPWSGTLSIDEEFPLTSAANGFIGTSLSYVGDRKGRYFTGTCVGLSCPAVPQATFPAYAQLDVRGGARFNSWTINAFVNNVTDKRGVLRAGRDASLSLLYVVTYVQPRTVGLSLTKVF